VLATLLVSETLCPLDLERDVDALLDQLGLDNSFFVELGIIFVLFLVLSNIYFKPFMKLFEARHKRTVEDKEAAERLMSQANSKLDEYKKLLAEERLNAKKDFEQALAEARKQESALLAEAREEAKKITQEAAESINRQRGQLKSQLESDVEAIAQNISERLLSRKV
jgi:F-type H+-transporting ATPase subunit b